MGSIITRHGFPVVYFDNSQWSSALGQYVEDHEIPVLGDTRDSQHPQVDLLVALAWLEDESVERIDETRPGLHTELRQMLYDTGRIFLRSRRYARALVAEKPGYWAFLEDAMDLPGLRGQGVEARLGPVVHGRAVFDKNATARQYELVEWSTELEYCVLREPTASGWSLIHVEHLKLLELLREPVVISLILE